jgi:hypothetical protein
LHHGYQGFAVRGLSHPDFECFGVTLPGHVKPGQLPGLKQFHWKCISSLQYWSHSWVALPGDMGRQFSVQDPIRQISFIFDLAGSVAGNGREVLFRILDGTPTEHRHLGWLEPLLFAHIAASPLGHEILHLPPSSLWAEQDESAWAATGRTSNNQKNHVRIRYLPLMRSTTRWTEVFEASFP